MLQFLYSKSKSKYNSWKLLNLFSFSKIILPKLYFLPFNISVGTVQTVYILLKKCQIHSMAHSAEKFKFNGKIDIAKVFFNSSLYNVG